MNPLNPLYLFNNHFVMHRRNYAYRTRLAIAAQMGTIVAAGAAAAGVTGSGADGGVGGSRVVVVVGGRRPERDGHAGGGAAAGGDVVGGVVERGFRDAAGVVRDDLGDVR